jgi:predicted  nucleic acid-binding Zn-ribbon protein
MPKQSTVAANAAALQNALARAEAEREGLARQLADVHAALAGAQQQLLQLSDVKTKLQLQVSGVPLVAAQLLRSAWQRYAPLRRHSTMQVKAATTEYRGNDIICISLRHSISALEQQLQTSRVACAAQAQQLAASAAEAADLSHCKANLGQQLSQLQKQHAELQDGHAAATQQLEQARSEMQHMQRCWQDTQGDQARQLLQAEQQLQAAQAQGARLQQQLRDEQTQRAAVQARCAELDGELARVRELVLLLGKALGSAAGRLPSGVPKLPRHDDPVWRVLGPLGGVAHTLDVCIKAVRVGGGACWRVCSTVDRAIACQLCKWAKVQAVAMVGRRCRRASCLLRVRRSSRWP